MSFIVVVMAVVLAMNAARADAKGPVTFGRRLAQSALAAALGSYLGYEYAQTLPEGEARNLARGMYVTAGAVVGVLVLRMSTLLIAIFREFRKR